MITKEWVNKKKKELRDKGLPDQLRKITIGGNVYVIRAVTYKEYSDLEAKYVSGNPKIKALESDEEVKRLRDLQNKVSNMIIETLQAKGGMSQKEYEEYMLNPDLLLSGRKDYKAIRDEYNELTRKVSAKIDKITLESMEQFNKALIKTALVYPDVDVESLPAFAIEHLIKAIEELSGSTTDVVVEPL